jgi:CRP/FNR family cyclic AMP-dependent transcriptional regulator
MDVRDLPLFAGVPDDHLEWALGQFKTAEVDFGIRLMEEGEVDSSLLCVVSGELEIKTGDTMLGRAGPGDVVGEIALFGYGMRMASVETLTTTELLILDREGYDALRDAGSPVALSVENLAFRQLVERLTSTSDRIADLAKGTPAATMTPPKSFFQKVASLFGGGGRRDTKTLNVQAILRNAPFFQDAPDAGLDELATIMRGVEFSAGEFICTQGELGDEMFIVAEGIVDVVIATANKDLVEPLAALEPGDAFGMLSLLDSRPRTASCIAKQNVAALVLDQANWNRLIADNSPGGSALRCALVRCLADQLAFANAQLSQLDLTSRRQDGGDDLQPLLMASASMDSWGRNTTGGGD